MLYLSLHSNSDSGKTHIDHRDQEREKAQHMQGQDEELQLRQQRAGIHVDKNSHGHDGPVDKCTLPLGPRVVGIVHRDEGEDQVAGEVGGAGDESLPAAYHEPPYCNTFFLAKPNKQALFTLSCKAQRDGRTHYEAEELLTALRGQHKCPVVLSS